MYAVVRTGGKQYRVSAGAKLRVEKLAAEVGQEIVLDQWDVVSVPPGVMRGFRNAGDAGGYLLAVLGGTDAGHVAWAPQVLERAKGTGLGLDAQGNLVPSRT